jgi:hypothetical protein
MARKRLMVLLLVPLVLGLVAGEADAKRKKNKPPKIATGPMDNGTLDPFWFGEGLEFREADEIDYLWVKEGFAVAGRTLVFKEWPEPEFLGEDAADRDEDDRRLARMMSSDMARTFAEVWGERLAGRVETSLESGDVVVEGRVVDCSTGSTATKVLVGFGAGSGNTTIDVKLTDAESGELLAGFHHRVVSGTTWSTTDSKFVKWIGKVAEEVADESLFGLYEDGDPTNK